MELHGVCLSQMRDVPALVGGKTSSCDFGESGLRVRKTVLEVGVEVPRANLAAEPPRPSQLSVTTKAHVFVVQT